MYNFVDLELDDEQKLDYALPCPTAGEKPMVPQYPYGLRITLNQADLNKLECDPSCLQAGGVIHGHFLAKITDVSLNDRVNAATGEKSEDHRVELQITHLCVESEDEENEEADGAMHSARPKERKSLYA